MKLVLQIAGGLVVGVFVILFLLGLGLEYQAKEAAKEIAVMQNQRSIENARSREKMKKKLEAERNVKAPVSNLQWSLPDNSAQARQRYITNQQRAKKATVYSSAPNNDPERLERNKEIINQLIKKIH